VLIAGEQELTAGAVVLRNMATREQALIPVDRLVEKVAATVKE
jgi:histidyl-tRNA synthetase